MTDPPRPRARPSRGLLAFRGLHLAGVVVLLFACGGPIQQDELDCEEAVARLDGCCPGFDSSGIACVHEIIGDGCNAQEILPAIDSAGSQCIRSESCAELQSSGVCQRAQRPSSEAMASLRVCP